MEILKIQSITKKFGTHFAVNGVSFSVEKGSIFGLLGPNGAGKTTTLRMMTNVLMPDSGTIEIFGVPAGYATQDRIGYLPEERGLYKKIKVIDQLIYFGQLKGMSRGDATIKAKYWLKRLDAGDWEKKKIQELSKGMAQKVQFISTILHSPDLLILDEPFSGFDPVNAELLKKIIIDMKEEGKTIILSTHVMEQVEQLCDNICLIDTGRVILSGNVRTIKSGYGRDTVLLEFEGDDSFLDGFSNLSFINRTKNRVEFRLLDSTIKSNDILAEALKYVKIFRYDVVEPSLNEIFIDTVTHNINNIKNENNNGVSNINAEANKEGGAK
ncbi:MAG: transporter protein [Ignavibacteria bacterium]|nr:transporter protein [Ignavibacteria bacterium]